MFLNLECNGTLNYLVYYRPTAARHTPQLVRNHYCYCLGLTAISYPTEVAILPTKSLNTTEITDYREEILLNSSSARALAANSIFNAQSIEPKRSV